jgi:SSS family solute:Na+ symporter
MKGMFMISGIDTAIVVSFFLAVAVVGLLVSKRASGSLEDFFLAGRKIPWFILGIAGMASFIDMSGTMLQTSFFYMIGVKGYWVAYRGAVALVLAFSMIFIAKWLRRSGVMTNAAFLQMRFGAEAQGKSARLLSVISIIAMIVPGIAFAFIGMKKFIALFVPPDLFMSNSQYFTSADIIALIIFGIVTLYTAMAGFYGVVFTDLVQSILIVGVMVYVIFKSIVTGTPEYFAKYASPDWLNMTPQWNMDMPAGYESMKCFGLLLFSWVVMNIMQGFAHPIDAASSQKFFSAKDERESCLVPLQWIIMFSLRFALMMGIAVLAIQFKDQISDPEQALPFLISKYFPTGLKGIFIAALIAASTSVLCGMVNGAAAYFVCDIYQAYIKPAASRKNLVRVSSITTVALVALGCLIGWLAPKINDIWVFIMMGLMSGLMVPNILKWFWWRFNGMGFVVGSITGMVSPLICKALEAAGLISLGATETTIFWVSIAASLLGTIIGTYLGKPTDNQTLLVFYKQIRPFGFWGPIRAQCEPPLVTMANVENRRDLWLLIPACLFQLIIFWLMTAVVVRKWVSFNISLTLLVIISIILYKYWYKNLTVNMDNHNNMTKK